MSYKDKKPQILGVSDREGTGQTLSLIKIQSKGISETLRGSPSKRVARTVVYCNHRHTPGRGNCPAADTRCCKCNKMGHCSIVRKSVPVKTVNQVLETEDVFSPTFVGGVTAPTCSNTSTAEPVANPQTGRSDPGWHV